jgi:alkaline phosphatase D
MPLLLIAACLLCLPLSPALARPAEWRISDGHLQVAGERIFLKIAKPLRNFADPAAVDRLIDDLDLLQAKGYNVIEINCYWHHFDFDGDGVPDRSTEPLAKLVRAIHARGMFPCLSTETYGVGGGNVPGPFWDRYPDAVAVNAQGKEVRDTEYGFESIVPSLFHQPYLDAARRFVRHITEAVPNELILYYETTVEPQFIGNQWLDFSDHGRRAYEAWREANGGAGPDWPEAFPVEGSFLEDPDWRRFRAEALAEWVNLDGQVYRDVAGEEAYIAVDYLETGGGEMPQRNGDSRVFLEQLTVADIIQVNWHWNLATRSTNTVAYRNVREVAETTGRDWVITEHMTMNPVDFRTPERVPAILRSTLEHGTVFGWEFVNVKPSTDDPFAMYHDDWSPKPIMAAVDDRWDHWQQVIQDAIDGKQPGVTGLETGPMVGHTTDSTASIWAYDSEAESIAVELWRAGPNPEERQRFTLPPADGRRPVFRHTFIGLEPQTAYLYSLQVAGRDAAVGSFTTAPVAGEPAQFSYVVTSCMNPRQWPIQPAWDQVRRQRPAFHLLIGDNVYADSTDYDVLWQHHREQRAVPNFANVLANVPSYATWDDHDFGPNDSHAQTPGKENSLAAFKDLWANPGYGTRETPGVFYRFRWADVDYFVLDNRYHRTDEHADVPDKTQFGEAQLRWLYHGLKDSEATFKIVVTGYDVMGSRYPDEIKVIADLIRRSGAAGVLFHAGDIHRNELKQQDHGAGYPITQITSSGIARNAERPWAMIDIDTTLDDPTLTARFFVKEKLDQTHTLRLSDLTPTP